MAGVKVYGKVDRVQIWIDLVLAVLLFISPWALNYAGVSTAAWNAWVLGVVVAVLAVLALTQYAQWQAWLTAILGIWVLIAPWVLGFSNVGGALWSHVILGILIALVALWRAWEDRQGMTRATV